MSILILNYINHAVSHILGFVNENIFTAQLLPGKLIEFEISIV